MKAYLCRRYHFSASHRLNSETYDDARNIEVYGKCNNPHGHGHNYTVEVRLSGQVDPVTGMVCNLADLDAYAHENLLDRFDHMNLNQLGCFENLVSSTENLSIEIYRIFAGFPGAHLERIHIEETSNNSFDYAGGSMAAAGIHEERPGHGHD